VLSAQKLQLSTTHSPGFHTLCATATQQSRKTRTKYVRCPCHHSWATRKLHFCSFHWHCALTSPLLAHYSLASATHSSRTSSAAPFSDASLIRSLRAHARRRRSILGLATLGQGFGRENPRKWQKTAIFGGSPKTLKIDPLTIRRFSQKDDFWENRPPLRVLFF